jgi:hypothetical protein
MMPKVFFIHIQKTSGTSMRVFLERGYGKPNCIWHAPRPIDESHDDLFAVAESAPDRLINAAVVGGHVGFGKIPKVILDQDPVFLSIMRDPVARVVSHYQHIRTSPNHGLNKQVMGKTLKESLTAIGFHRHSEEAQIEMLCGAKNLDTLHRVMGERKFVVGKQAEVLEYLEYCAGYLGVRFFKEARVNQGAPGYIDEIADQPGYWEALELIKALNPLEYEFYNSFGSVWSNVGN